MLISCTGSTIRILPIAGITQTITEVTQNLIKFHIYLPQRLDMKLFALFNPFKMLV